MFEDIYLSGAEYIVVVLLSRGRAETITQRRYEENFKIEKVGFLLLKLGDYLIIKVGGLLKHG